jgi:hypothetical protein
LRTLGDPARHLLAVGDESVQHGEHRGPDRRSRFGLVVNALDATRQRALQSVPMAGPATAILSAPAWRVGLGNCRWVVLEFEHKF